jgi:flavin reductase (DIM6/NTAB) family NADH-FMN oxidoreductase RutF
VVGFTPLPSRAVKPPRIAEAPVAFECTLWEKLETQSRQIFIGQVRWMHARDELIDTDTWRVRLQHYFPVGRFGASFYVKTRERYSLAAQDEIRSTQIDEM